MVSPYPGSRCGLEARAGGQGRSLSLSPPGAMLKDTRRTPSPSEVFSLHFTLASAVVGSTPIRSGTRIATLGFCADARLVPCRVDYKIERMVYLETAIQRMQLIVAINTLPNRPAEHDVSAATALTADTGVPSSTVVSAANINSARAIAPAGHHGYLQITNPGDCEKKLRSIKPPPSSPPN
jgi:hypothetical protein